MGLELAGADDPSISEAPKASLSFVDCVEDVEQVAS